MIIQILENADFFEVRWEMLAKMFKVKNAKGFSATYGKSQSCRLSPEKGCSGSGNSFADLLTRVTVQASLWVSIMFKLHGIHAK